MPTHGEQLNADRARIDELVRLMQPRSRSQLIAIVEDFARIGRVNIDGLPRETSDAVCAMVLEMRTLVAKTTASIAAATIETVKRLRAEAER